VRFFATLILGALVSTSARGADDPRLVVLKAVQTELARSQARLQLPGEDKPYFIRYLVRDYDEREIGARFGAIVDDSSQRARHASVEVRVGNYKFDNTANTSDNAYDFDDFQRYRPPVTAPLDDDVEVLRATLWLQTDAEYKSALSALHKKRGKRVTNVVEDENLPSFSRTTKQIHIDAPVPIAFEMEVWREKLRRLSALFKRHPTIFDSSIKVSLSHQTRTLATSEGTALINDRIVFGLHLNAVALGENGLLVNHGKSVYGATEQDLPDEKTLTEMVALVVREVEALRKAPMLDPYNGPAILLPEAAGVFFHEALGHRLEGERQNSNHEGATFKGQIGKPVLPTFISVIDDPSLRSVGKISLNGYYRYDDEGVVSTPVKLVENGILRSYLMSRTPVKGVVQSNGHGRSESTSDPIGRMANTIVRSTKQVPYATLKQMLLEEIKRQKKDFGLIISDITGGQTNTSSYDFQAFKGVPRIVYRVDAVTGKETMVKGVEFVGTPIGSLNRIAATSDEIGVFNGFCGAESGYIPVSTVAPAILISEIELQRTGRELERGPVLPPPWAEQPKKK